MTKPFAIVDRSSGVIVGYASTKKGAIRACDRRNNQYGCYQYRVVNLVTGQSVIC